MAKKELTPEQKEARRERARKRRAAKLLTAQEVEIIEEEAKDENPVYKPIIPSLPEPNTFKDFKKYIIKQFRDAGWKNKQDDYNFPNTCVHIKNFKLKQESKKNKITVSFDAYIQSSKEVLVKNITQAYYKKYFFRAKNDITAVQSEIENPKFIKGNKITNLKELLSRGWKKAK